MAKDHGPSIKDDEQYEALREEGISKDNARIAERFSWEADDITIIKAKDVAALDEVARRGGEAAPYEEWTVEELQTQAGEIEIDGRSSMDKSELIEALRDH